MYSGGFTGKVLRVDLSSGVTSVEDTPDPDKYLGPRGWNAKVGFEEIGSDVSAYDEGNKLMISVGPLTGTHSPTSGRSDWATIAPRGYPEPMYQRSGMGGDFPPEIKFAGYDQIIIEGKSDKPCYIQINDDKVSIEDGSEVWGKDVYSAQRWINDRHEGEYEVSAIGPAGENEVRFACITSRLANAVGNAGFGGVMGSKNLKAIAVRGTNGVDVAEPEKFMDAVNEVWEEAKGGISRVGSLNEDQTFPDSVGCSHACDVVCYTSLGRTTGGYGWNMKTCVDGAWVGGGHPDYQGYFLEDENNRELDVPRPPGLGEPGEDLVAKAEYMGITSWSYDTWYRYFKGLKKQGIDEIDGYRLEPDKTDFWDDWINKVSYRKGIGDDMAEGLARFSDKYEIDPELADFIESKGSRGHAWHREGRSMEPHPIPFWVYSSLIYAIASRDPTPNHHEFFFLTGEAGYAEKSQEVPREECKPPERLAKLSKDIYGSEKTVYPNYEGVELAAYYHKLRSVIKDCAPACDWTFPMLRKNFKNWDEKANADSLGPGMLEAESKLYSTCTGLDISNNEMESPKAERIVNLERAIQVKNHKRKREIDEYVINHFKWPEKEKSWRTHISKDATEWKKLLTRFYEKLGWDTETGRPTRSKLEELDLNDVADKLEEKDLLGSS
ncbi:MAG: Aldehyde:ferredoxin oxidoreductase [Candidatus Methanohalarchaeum thermophilum]|uniref:Aldehyde:ferredoxin oxidoreductase n=1 Tax=Methanohalarchaeum thermophilum TaxID=1903181 RepID=A0A1Q6DWT1_METT1|nr:MAG: Aldehyde:ferredoxin oxidoreductase [Candidatus Methanohalarchaeum thermophilum]